ncbi:RNA polymerase sigma factor SigJ [Actinophytocola xanthii]|uniref:RNA polymerase subunit sigma-70 n=1 Tax=Actinophytocola xanthii TaxID=1912961 RepID=A0A1Q8CBS7_9PSEU|nr:RNA polymerase sigma factor SigJ [Actinophytocola xanthii]OLF11818.1 RNA polymerase subunit sigma-70 [Actinophytocola xanthii]
MDENSSPADRFAEHRPRLRAVAYRMLGSLTEADDAVQEAWLRLERADTGEVDNLGAWLTTVVARICLNMLRARATRREEPLEVHMPDPLISSPDAIDPEQEALLADAVGLALLVVLDALTPAERLAFVLHDMFAVPFEEIASMTERSPAAARKLASRARRRVREAAPTPDPDLTRQRRVVEAFFAAARRGDFAGLLAVLDPEVVLRADGGAAGGRPTFVVRGPEAVLGQAMIGERFAPLVRPALVNGAAGVVVAAGGRTLSVMGFTVADDRIVAIDVLWDPDRLTHLYLGPLAEGGAEN